MDFVIYKIILLNVKYASIKMDPVNLECCVAFVYSGPQRFEEFGIFNLTATQDYVNQTMLH